MATERKSCLSKLASLKTMLKDRTDGRFGNPESLYEFLIRYNKVCENDSYKLTDQEITHMWNGVLEEQTNTRKEEIEERELKASADAIKAKTEAVSDAINAIENATFEAVMAKEKEKEKANKEAETQAKIIANQIDQSKYTEAKIKAMADPKFIRCCEENLKVGDHILGLKKKHDGTYELAYKCTFGRIEEDWEHREMWMTCGLFRVTRYFDTEGNPIESIETLFKEVMMNMACFNVKVGDKACSENGSEAGIVTQVSFTYSEGWHYSDGPTKTKMVRVDCGDLVEASNFYIRV
jgi:hypothetical protein